MNLNSEEFKGYIDEIKHSISEDALLALPSPDGIFILTTDASNIGIGAILSQMQNGREKILAYYSSLHTDVERRYSTTDQELLAVVEAIKHFRPYLFSKKFILRTDHKALLYMFKKKFEF